MQNEKDEKIGWFKALLAKYNDFCKELGVDNGACRGCVPVVKFDPEPKQVKATEKTTSTKSSTAELGN